MIRNLFFKKLFASVLLLCILLSCSLVSCSNDTDDEISIVVTVFPVYDWVRNILGDNPSNVKLSLLTGDGKDIHSYQASVDDMALISSADLLIYVGGESERWVEDAIRSTRNDECRTLRLMDIVGVCDEDLHGGEYGDHDHSEADEHVWLSLKYAAQICRKIAYEITIIDSESSELYLSLCDGYISELMKLDESYSTAVNEGVRDTLIFVDRFPFVYLLADYGIKHYAAFEGCSSDSDISFEAVIELAKRVDEVGAGYVLIIDGNDGKMANTVISNTKDKSCRVLALDSMQSVSLAEMDSEYSYLSVMRENLEVIRLALS